MAAGAAAVAELKKEVEALRKQIIDLGATPVASGDGWTHKAEKTGNRKKGVAICSEQVVDPDFVAPSFPKGPGTRVLIEGAMSASAMFNNLSKAQCEAVVMAMYPAQRSAGEPIVVQGEPASNYFVVDVGKCDVWNSGELVLTIGSGASFGEIALMYEVDNNVTIKAHVDVTVWTIDRQTFRSIVVNETSARRRQYEDTIAKVALFEALTKAERALMADALEDKVYADGHVIMQEGAEGDYFYIVTKGTVNVMVSGELVATRGAGEYVGERALLTNEKRMASCIAAGEAECARMDRDTFVRILGPLGDLLSFRKYDEAGNEIVTEGAGAAEDDAATSAVAAPAHFEFSDPPGGSSNPPMARDDFTTGPTLGIGAFGYVQLVHYKKTDKVYALKTLTKKSILKTDQLQHCHDEIANLHASMNPFIVNLYSCFCDPQHIFMVMEFVAGGELYSVIQRGRMRNDDARLLAAEILLGLEFSHSQQVIYRDLKPENVLLDKDGHVKITDFGLSKKVVDRTFTLCGTPDYIAPEIIQNKGHNKAADYWALGVVIYEMLTGLPPFYKENEDHTTFDRICGLTTSPPKFSIKYPRYLSSEAHGLIEGMLQPDVTKRVGCMKAGTADIKQSEWFDGFSWEDCAARRMPGPFPVDMRSDEDVSAFDDYSGERLPKGKSLKDHEAAKFETYP
jgi:cGMP-dependent protein kinase